jgi:hypothetical protein
MVKNSENIEGYEGTAEIMLELIHKSDKWLDKILWYTGSIGFLCVLLWTVLWMLIAQFVEIEWGGTLFLIWQSISLFIWVLYFVSYYLTKHRVKKWKKRLEVLKQNEQLFLSQF